jgi:hypothetical protein
MTFGKRRSVSFKAWVLVALMTVGWLTLGLLARLVHEGFGVGVFALAIVVISAFYRLRCPRCRYPVLVIRRVAGISLLRSWPPPQCPHCGLPSSAAE